MKCRILKNKECKITCKCSDSHVAVDIVRLKGNVCLSDVILAHSGGTVIKVVKGKKKDLKAKGNDSYGNYIMIKHYNGYITLYAHLRETYVKVGDKIKGGTAIGYMGDSGVAYGVHLHFEIRKNEKYSSRINPTPYLNSDLPNTKKTFEYRVFNKNHWYSWTNKVAGNINDKKGISGIQFKSVNCGYFVISSYVKGKGWQEEICKCDDSNNGYSGIKNIEMEAFMIKSELVNLKYRVYDGTLNKWLPYVTGYNKSDKINGYAGIIGHSIKAIEIVKL